MNCSVVIVSYNTKKLTLQTISSVFASSGPKKSYEVIVVDNNSQDGSVEAIKEIYGNQVKVIQNTTNTGFAIANNQAIKQAKAPYVLLLNSDTVVQPNTISTMIDTMEKNPSYGIVSCRLLNRDHSYQPQGGAIPHLLNLAAWWLWPLNGVMPGVEPYQNPQIIPETKNPQDIVPTGWVGGTAMMIRRLVIQKVGFFDEAIFMYAEDIDYCIRTRNAGFLVGIVPAASLIHFGSASGNSINAKKGEITGLLYVFRKHTSASHVFFLRLILVTGSVLRYLLFGILQGKNEAKELYRSIASLAFH